MNPIDIKYLLEAINASKYKPKDKEIGFLKDMQTLVDEGKYATKPQSDWLQAIYRNSQDNRGHQNRGYV